MKVNLSFPVTCADVIVWKITPRMIVHLHFESVVTIILPLQIICLEVLYILVCVYK